jgi:3-deoxy-D-manno-octulosonic-acid transferase
MENFEPLAGRLVAADACIRANDHSQLVAAIRRALDPQEAQEISTRAIQILSTHQNATRRVINILNAHPRPAN